MIKTLFKPSLQISITILNFDVEHEIHWHHAGTGINFQCGLVFSMTTLQKWFYEFPVIDTYSSN